MFPENCGPERWALMCRQGAFCVKFTNAVDGPWELLSEEFSSHLRSILKVFYSHRISDKADNLYGSTGS